MNYTEMKNQNILLNVENLKKYFPIFGGVFSKKIGEIKAVDNVSFKLYKGETLGLVGESGCGKSTTGRTLINLYDATEGNIFYCDYENERALDVTKDSVLYPKFIRRQMQMIFQDPYASLNPRMSIGSIIEEPLIIHNIGENKKERKEMVEELLKKVGLEPHSIYRYPHEFSGGQRQRIGIARSLALNPSLIIADEPVSALDVSIQAQVLKLLKKLQDERNLTYLFITHDLSVVEYVSDRIAVMYLGKVVELATTDELFRNTLHPYTCALLSAIPVADIKKKRKRIPLQGDVPSPVNPPSGCPFHPRCPRCTEKCTIEIPKLTAYQIGKEEHFVSCHFALEMMKEKK